MAAPTSIWRFNGKVIDEYRVNNGTAYNSPTYSQGLWGSNAINIVDHSTQYVATAQSYANPQTYTILAWFRANSTANSKVIISFADAITGACSNYDRVLAVGSSGNVNFYGYPGMSMDAGNGYDDYKWHCVMVTTQSSGSGYLYVDGSYKATDTTEQASYTGYWKIGARVVNTSSEFDIFDGQIQDLMWWNNEVKTGQWFKKYYANATGQY